MAVAAILDLFEPQIAPFDPPTVKTLPRTKHEVDRITRYRDMAIRVSWGHMEPPLWEEGEVVGVSEDTIRKSDGSFLYALHCDHCAICNHSAAICYRMSPTLKSTGGGSLWAQIWGCSAWSRPMMFGSAESEHPRLTNGEIISDVFQPM